MALKIFNSNSALFQNKCQHLGLGLGAQQKLMSMYNEAFSPKANTEINWDDVRPLSSAEQLAYDELPIPSDPVKLLDELAVVKLNGGLGTTMGCQFPKSLVQCAGGQTFFDITADQITELNKKYSTNVPLVLMNSFYTNDLMKSAICSKSQITIKTFNQNKFPKIYADTLMPVPQSPDSPDNEWAPPGHGDVFHCLRDSGLLNRLLSKGRRFLFVSNIDNVGARVDLRLLGVLAAGCPFVMETVARTEADWKGGVPVKCGGRVRLAETAQVPEDKKDLLRGQQFATFNTNSMWISLEALRHALETGGPALDVIANPKTLNGRKIFQLESAAGSAIGAFPGAAAVRVGRERFLPVKTTGDLLVMRSDVFVRRGASLLMDPRRTAAGLGNVPPTVNLGKCMATVSAFEERIEAVPSLRLARSLMVDGDVSFGPGVRVEGDVVIRSKGKARIENVLLKNNELNL